jgi:CRP-like cAMP-binding protein
LKLSVIGAGLVFGDDDVLAKRNYKATFKCVTQSATIYVIKKEEFLRVFRTENDSWKI